MRGQFQGICQHWEVPLVEVLPPPVNVDHALTLFRPTIALTQGSMSQADQVLVDAPVMGTTRDDPFPSDHEDEPSAKLMIREDRSATKRWLALLDSVHTEGTSASFISRHLRKRQNLDFMLGDFDIVVDVLDDEPSKQLEGIDEEATEQPREPEKEPEDVATLKEGVFGLVLDDISQVAPDQASLSMNVGAVIGSSSAPSVTLGIYVP